ncbi:hypothetical protein [Ornithinicoccus halotolerans]|uniref:hypothetical protein n=1 Tax=Ornithinicoccus halotolerans TaxID=1748220 RepID=UPI0012959F82|nr:hypothetical protein [Ornithinicoccus halotolerans]
MTERLPDSVAINAWIGTAPRSPLADKASRWGSGGGLPHSQQPMDLGAPADDTDWRSPDVGYGVLLRDDPEVPDQAKATGADAPEPIRELLAGRPGTVMLRWSPALDGSDQVLAPHRHLRRYFADGTFQDPSIGASAFGTGKGRLPRYILIVGGPDQVPWRLQYTLQTRHHVGRLPLAEDGLGHYVSALLHGFDGAEVDVRAPLQWTVSHPGDITADMRAVIADPLAGRLTDPQLPRYEHLTDGSATGAGLLDRLAATRPALVVTSSHGLAEGDHDTLRAGLGLPVDATRAPVPLDDLVAAVPGGAVWYSQACCSAGSDGASKYPGLLPAGPVLDTVENVAALGSTVAPAAVALLGRADPVRAVMGHVEPTFDWTLRDPHTGQGLAGLLVNALAANLHAGQPIGHAFKDYRSTVGALHSEWVEFYELLVNDHDTTVRPTLTRLRLTALDRQSLVLLGDPTVRLPELASAP